MHRGEGRVVTRASLPDEGNDEAGKKPPYMAIVKERILAMFDLGNGPFFLVDNTGCPRHNRSLLGSVGIHLRVEPVEACDCGQRNADTGVGRMNPHLVCRTLARASPL
jgi:hypothetical protein